MRLQHFRRVPAFSPRPGVPWMVLGPSKSMALSTNPAWEAFYVRSMLDGFVDRAMLFEGPMLIGPSKSMALSTTPAWEAFYVRSMLD